MLQQESQIGDSGCKDEDSKLLLLPLVIYPVRGAPNFSSRSRRLKTPISTTAC